MRNVALLVVCLAPHGLSTHCSYHSCSWCGGLHRHCVLIHSPRGMQHTVKKFSILRKRASFPRLLPTGKRLPAPRHPHPEPLPNGSPQTYKSLHHFFPRERLKKKATTKPNLFLHNEIHSMLKILRETMKLLFWEVNI